MKIAVPAEIEPNEKRVAATPETIRKLVGRGAEAAVQSGAGPGSRIPDSEFQAAGASIAPDAAATLAGADLVLKVRRPGPAELASYASQRKVLARAEAVGGRPRRRRASVRLIPKSGYRFSDENTLR